ncbi:MAG TPA: hypothetical protein PLS23_17910, partial [Phycisphaerae bacterium]|nr:hypothetical protein [Phycisphaerae bacterium]
MRKLTLIAAVLATWTPAVLAVPNFTDDFEAGVGGTHNWYNWNRGGTNPDPWPPPNPSGINNLLTTSDSHNHTPGGKYSAQAWASDPAAWNAYSDFG